MSALQLWEARCQGAAGGSGRWSDPLTAGSLCSDCIRCARRVEIEPGQIYTWMQTPTWLPWSQCPQRIEVQDEPSKVAP